MKMQEQDTLKKGGACFDPLTNGARLIKIKINGNLFVFILFQPKSLISLACILKENDILSTNLANNTQLI